MFSELLSTNSNSGEKNYSLQDWSAMVYEKNYENQDPQFFFDSECRVSEAFEQPSPSQELASIDDMCKTNEQARNSNISTGVVDNGECNFDNSDLADLNDDLIISINKSEFGESDSFYHPTSDAPISSNSNTIEESSYTEESEVSTKEFKSRWKKEDDQRLYKELQLLLVEYGYNIEEFIFNASESKYKMLINFLKRNLCPNNKDSECNVKKCKLCWKGTTELLIRRIRKIYIHRNEFTTREHKELRKTFYQMQKRGSIDWGKLSYTFPGKSEEMIKDTCRSFYRCKE